MMMRESTEDLWAAARIVRIVCKHFSCTPEELTGRSRTLIHARARFIATYFILKQTQLKTGFIAQFLDRDRTTVLYGQKSLRQDIDTDGRLVGDMAALHQEIYGHFAEEERQLTKSL